MRYKSHGACRFKVCNRTPKQMFEEGRVPDINNTEVKVLLKHTKWFCSISCWFKMKPKRVGLDATTPDDVEIGLIPLN